MWALGVSLYMWLYFSPPFEAPSMTELLEVRAAVGRLGGSRDRAPRPAVEVCGMRAAPLHQSALAADALAHARDAC